MPKTHECCKEPWYNSYRGMMYRCYNKKAANYKTYGGRGISVCDGWHEIERFKKWAETSGHEDGLTLDRINPNGNYEPENCRWATIKQQDNNRRNTVFLKHNGEIHTISEWAGIIGINRSTLNNRICRGWSAEKALTKSVTRVKSISTIEPIAPRGHWTINTDDFTPAWRCSNCGHNKPVLAGESAKQEPKSFCQSCGADMRGDHD